MDKLYMAVDLGTSFIKSGVFSLDGTMLASWSEPVKDERPAPGVFLQRGEFLYSAVCSCLQKTAQALGERAKDVQAIAFTGQMAGSMGVDENWGDVTTWSCSLDSRYLPFADSQRERFGGDMFEIGGTNAPVMCSKYEWFKTDFPEEHKRIAKYVMLNGYIIGRLAKIPIEEAKIDYSLITWTGMADIRKRAWSEKICEEIGMPLDMLPQIVACTCVGGYLESGAAKELGLPAGIPLVLGAGDKVSGCTGAGILNDGEMIFEAASYGAISCHVPDVRLDETRRNYDIIGGIDDRSFYAHKYIQGSGISTDWFVEKFIKEENESKKEAFRRAEEMSAGVELGSGKMLAVGLLSGSAMPFDSEIKGLFMGHTWMHEKSHFYHALMESFSYDLALTLEGIVSQYPQYADSPIKLIGGGAKSLFWPQMLADVTGHRFEQLDRADVALWGGALLAAAGVGDITDIDTLAKEKCSIKKVFEPDAARHAAYQPYVRFYEKITKEFHGYYEQLSRL